MSYINLSGAAKTARAGQISTSIGPGASLRLYTGSPPLSPDHPATGTLLVSLPLSFPAGTATYTVQSAAVVNPGSNGSDGVQSVVGTTGTGVKFQASVTIANGSITAIQSIAVGGAYSVPPSDLLNEPVLGANLTGASLRLIMTGQLTFNSVTQASAVATGTAGYARVADATGNGVIDLNCGTFGDDASVILNSTTINSDTPVAVISSGFTEA